MLLLVVIFILVPIFTYLSGYSNIVTSLSDVTKDGLAKIFVTMTFPLTGVMVFVLGQAVNLRREAIEHHIETDKKGYAFMSWMSVIALATSAIIGIVSVHYIITVNNTWLILSLYLVPLVLVLLIINALLFCIYTLTDWMI
jgi:hypothetical protein